MIDEDDIPTGEIEVDEDELDEEPDRKPRRVGPAFMLRLREMGEELIRRDDIVVHEFEVHDPASHFTMETLEHGLGFNVPTPIRSFYEISDGFELRWSRIDENAEETLTGEIHLFDFGEVFGNWLDVLWGVTGGEDDQDVDFSWDLRAVDHTPCAESDFMTVLHVPEMLPTFRLYFHDPTGETFPLRVDFVDYLDAMVESRGILGWQYLLADIDFDEHPDAREHVDEFRRLAAELFPDADLEVFEPSEESDTADDEEE